MVERHYDDEALITLIEADRVRSGAIRFHDRDQGFVVVVALDHHRCGFRHFVTDVMFM